MNATDDLIEFLKGWESLKLKSSADIAAGTFNGMPRIFDVGYGHVIHPDDHPMTITHERADELLRDDVDLVVSQVRDLVTVTLLPQEADALISFAYNVGAGPNGLGGSTLLRLLNEGDTIGAAAQFARWNKAGGKIRNGLIKRRRAEREMFLYGDYSGRP